jgi:hypothetical protein
VVANPQSPAIQENVRTFYAFGSAPGRQEKVSEAEPVSTRRLDASRILPRHFQFSGVPFPESFNISPFTRSLR